MAVSKSQQKAVHKYVKANYDRMELTVPKGRKELIKAHAEARGQSVNAYINAAIDEKMAQEAVGSSVRPTTSKAILGTADGGNGVLGPSEGRTKGIDGEGGA